MADGSASDSEQSIHVLLLPYPSQGHINPILQFGKRLAARRGVRCTLAATRFVLSQGNPSPGAAVRIAVISDGCDRGGVREAGTADAYLRRLEAAGSEAVDALLRSEREQGRPVRVLVYDAFLPWARRVAARHGAAAAAIFTQPCAVDVAYAHAFAGRIRPPLAGEEPVDLPGLPAGFVPGDMPSFLADPSVYPAYLDLLVNQFNGLDAADHVLVNSFYELQPQESDYMASAWRAKTVGPTVPSAFLDNALPDDTSYGFHLHTPLTAATKAWLDGRPARSVVYAAFGSISEPTAAQMAEVAEGLYNCGKPFLWVVRASETAKIPENFAEKAKESGIIVTWSPQLEVLAHPAVGCFVTHCGWNSTTEALCAGVPMVAMPQWSDQPTNAKYIEDVWRVGVRVRPDEEGVVRKEEVERCVREVMDGERSVEYRQNAATWKEKAKRAVSEGGSSDSNIVEFLGKLGLEV
ncbi:unnamed protein product [Urochloa decumbens]|uniref:Glycosyltransferase n=1 Tax=Urochloa decumbens TaxID=240449 RepID=A0ABC9G6D5_9POAL